MHNSRLAAERGLQRPRVRGAGRHWGAKAAHKAKDHPRQPFIPDNFRDDSEALSTPPGAELRNCILKSYRPGTPTGEHKKNLVAGNKFGRSQSR